jgi:ligand-binding sensor domain-containing protein
MNSLKHLFFGLLLISFTHGQLAAQVSSYKFEVGQETYTEITSATTLFSGQFTHQVSSAIQIPSFKYNNKFYDSIYVSSNGYVSFGPYAPEYFQYYPFSNYMEDEGIILGFAFQLWGYAHPNASISYKLTSSKLVIQYKDLQRNYISSGQDKINFQIHLNYSDYSIKLIYGDCSPGKGSYQPQVGLLGSHVNDYLALEVRYSGESWTNPSLANYKKGFCYFDSDDTRFQPPSGLTYTFYPSDIKKKCDIEHHMPYSFEHFAETNSVSDILDDGQYIWCGTSGGLIKRHRITGQILAKYDVNNGLPYPTVLSLAKDNQGYLWISCGRSIVKFDGKNFEIHDNRTSNGILSGSSLGSLTFDWNGNLWVSSYWGGGVYMYDGLKWYNFNTQNSAISDDNARGMAIDNHNNLWVGTYGGGVNKFDGKSWTNYTTSNSNIPSDYVTLIEPGNGDTLWMAFNTWDPYPAAKGIAYFINGSFTNFTTSNSNIHNDHIDGLGLGPNGKIWAGGYGGGVSSFDGNTWRQYSTYNSGLPNQIVYTIMTDNTGALWFGTNRGIARFYNNQWMSKVNENEIVGNEIYRIIPDNSGNIWISTNNGLSKYSNGNWSTPFVRQWLFAAAIDNSGNIWLGKLGGIQTKFNPINNTYQDYYILNKTTNDIFVDNQGNVWYASSGDGVAKYDGSTWTKYNTSNSQLPHDDVRAITQDNNGDMWFVTWGGGASKFDGTNWTIYNASNSGITRDYLFDITIGANGDIWIAQDYSGVMLYRNNSWGRYTASIAGLISESVTSLFYNSKTGNMWFGSGDGITCYDGRNYTSYSTRNGLPEERINSIYIDNNDNLWLGTIGGITKLSYQKPFVDFFATTACYPAKTQLTDVSCNVDMSTTFEWDIDNDGEYELIGKNQYYAFPNYGIYPIKLRVSNNDQVDSFTKNVTVGLKPQIQLSPDNTASICSGQSQLLSTSITNYNSQFTYDYYWNTGDSVGSISVSEEGKYKVRAGIDECYSDWDSVDLKVSVPFDSAEICMVSVDEYTGKNMVIWERHANRGIASYNIYKLYGSNYMPIGNVGISQLSVFIDQSSDPDTRAARYAISVVDTCGNESAISPFHQTIQLGASQGVKPNTAVLDWTEYIDESGDFQPDWYYIYKGSHPTALQLFDSVSATFTEWNDTNAVGALYYQVSVVKPDLCSPSVFRAQNYGGPFSQSMSNMKDYGQDQNDYLEVSPSYQYIAKKNGSSTTFNIFTNLDSFKVECNESWLDISVNELAKFFIVTANSEATTERTATITVSGGGIAPVNVTLVQGETVSLFEGEIDDVVKVFPNPSSGKLFVRVEGGNEFELKVIDLNGKTHLQNRFSANINNELDLHNLAKGIYLIQILNEQGIKIRRIVMK